MLKIEHHDVRVPSCRQYDEKGELRARQIGRSLYAMSVAGEGEPDNVESAGGCADQWRMVCAGLRLRIQAAAGIVGKERRMIVRPDVSYFFGCCADQLPALAAGWNYVESAEEWLMVRGFGDALFYVMCDEGDYMMVPRVVSRGVDPEREIRVPEGEVYVDLENIAPLPTAAREGLL